MRNFPTWNFWTMLLCCVVATLTPADRVGAASADAPFAGRFSGETLTVDWTSSGAIYKGTLSLGQQSFPSVGTADGQKIAGTFDANGKQFTFEGTLEGDTLVLTSGNKNYTLKRDSPAPNPLAVPSMDTHSTDLPAGYKIANSTDAGRSLMTSKPGVQSVTAALRSTLPDLSHYFDGKPQFTGAYEDSRDKRNGGAPFTATLKGEQVKGLVTCRLMDTGASVAVIYVKSTATPADWRQLTGPASGATSQASAPAGPPLQVYNFPDGTGSIGIAPGWTTHARTCNGEFILLGPANQQITMGLAVDACTPDSLNVRQNQQMNAMARKMGGKVVPLEVCVAPLTDPVDVFKNIMPQMSRKSEQRHGPSWEIDNLKLVRELQPGGQGVRASICRYGISLNNQGQKTHRQVIARVGVMTLGKGSYVLRISSEAAPDATFQQDLPAMSEMVASLRPNNAVINGEIHQQMQNQNQWFAAQQASSKELSAAYDDYNKDMARNSTIQSRSNDNEQEIIRGVRTVEDTRTGEQQSVNLFNVDQIVDNLNHDEPGRYRPIPLRDEADPLP